MTSPDSSEQWLQDILDAVVSDVQASGYFDRVNTHENKRAPGNGLNASVWFQGMQCVGEISGLKHTCAQVIFVVRMYCNMLEENQDLIDPNLMRAASNLIRRYHDDFDFAGLIRNVDMFGKAGTKLSAISGYIEIDGRMFRIVDLFVPCLVNDVWEQIA